MVFAVDVNAVLAGVIIAGFITGGAAGDTAVGVLPYRLLNGFGDHLDLKLVITAFYAGFENSVPLDGTNDFLRLTY